MEWKKVKLGDCCDITSSKRFHLSERTQTGVPFYCTKEIIQKLRGDKKIDCDYIPEDLYLDIKKKFGVPTKDDLLLTTRGTIGIPYLYKDTDRFYFADGNLSWFRKFNDYLNPNYLYYWFLSPNGRFFVNSIAVGTAQKAVPIAGLMNLTLSLPPLPYQRRISSILSDYDSLIENYQRQISLLEESAKRIYKEWFVDFKFPGVEMAENGLPKGWQKKKLGEICESITRTSNDLKEQLIFLNTGDVENGEILHSNYSPTTEMPGQAKKLIKKNDILYSEIRPINRHFAYVNFDCEDYIVSTKLMVIKAKDGINSRRLYQFLTFDDTIKALQIEAESRSGTFPQIRFENVSKLHLIIGDERIEKEYDCVLSDFFTKIENMKTQIRLLRQNRDILLPRLMNGEIEIEG